MSIDGRCRTRSHTRALGSQCTRTSQTKSIGVSLRKQRQRWSHRHQQQWKHWKWRSVKTLWPKPWIVSGWRTWTSDSNVCRMQIPTDSIAMFAGRTCWYACRSGKNFEENWRSKEIERLLSADEIVRQYHHCDGKLSPNTVFLVYWHTILFVLLLGLL